MPIASRGTDVALQRNARTGKWDLIRGADGNPERTDSQQHRILSLLIERRPSPGQPGWILDDTKARGSLLYTRGTDTRATPSSIQADCYQALERAIDEGWILGPSVADEAQRLVVTATRTAAGRIEVEVNYSTPAGVRERVAFSLRP